MLQTLGVFLNIRPGLIANSSLATIFAKNFKLTAVSDSPCGRMLVWIFS